MPNVTSDFVYLRLQNAHVEIETGCSAEALERWMKLAKAWAQGEQPKQHPLIATESVPKKLHDVFVYFFAGAKERNPAAAEAMIKLLS